MIIRTFKNVLVILAISTVLMVTGCTGKGGSFDMRKPVSLDLEPPEGPPEYRQGWTDGCESGMNVYSADFYKLMQVFEYKQDPQLKKNKIYAQVWKDAYLYCALYMMTTNQFKI